MLDQGILHFDVYGSKHELDPRWEHVRKQVKQHGTRNSLFVALMPTASTAQIMGNYESFEPIPNNLFVRSVLAGEFIVINRYLVKDLEAIGAWNQDTKDSIVRNNGSIQHLDVSAHIKDMYKTIWEIKQKDLLDMALDRSPFVDQSQSFNVHFAKPEFNKIYSYHLYAWEQGAKTGSYYVRTQAAADPVKFSLGTATPATPATPTTPTPATCVMDEGCLSCSS
jgi:ribonucleotide reductase alpha subunit